MDKVEQAVRHISKYYPIEPVLGSLDRARGWHWFVLVPGSRQFLTDEGAIEMSDNLYRIK